MIAITRSLTGSSPPLRCRRRQAGQREPQLTIPTRNLDTAIDRLTELGDVDSLNEASEDITRPFVTAKDDLNDAEAQRRKLLEALGNATTDTEAEALRLQIDDARKEIAQGPGGLRQHRPQGHSSRTSA